MKNENNKKTYFTVKFTHNEETFRSLSHMQYDLFCRRNLIARTVIGFICICIGVLKLENWWSYLLIVYGVYLITGKYNQANHTAKKLADGIKEAKLQFPSSKYIFEDRIMRVVSQPDGEELTGLYYSDVMKLGQDRDYFYIFRNSSGGYMIPRASLGDREDEFIDFIKDRTGQIIYSKYTPPYKKMLASLKKKKNEPYHL